MRKFPQPRLRAAARMDANRGPNHQPILVTGAAGFVGGALVRRLIAAGAEVHALLRQPCRAWRLRGLDGKLHTHGADLTDTRAVEDVLRAVRPRVVVHLATYGAYESQSDGATILRANVLGTWNLLEAARSAGVRLVVNAGSSSEYGYR